MTTSVVLLSGGVDSATALAAAVRAGDVPVTLSVDYGQRHGKELGYAARLAHHYGSPNVVVDLTSWGALLVGSSELLGTSGSAGSGAATVVPNRNAMLAAVAGSYAMARGLDTVVIGTHAGDREVYADCRSDWLEAMDDVLFLASEGSVRLRAPFGAMSESEVVSLASQLGVPFDLTWSCYNAGDLHCGRCGACVKRRSAFVDASLPDPTAYAEIR